MRLFELEQPAVGDILEIELGDAIVEAVITAIEGDEIIAETDNHRGASILAESYGKYYCSTDKKWKTRKGPKQTRKVNEFAPDGFNGGDDGEEFNPNLAKMAYDEGVVKGASLADGATLERAMAINDWDKHAGGIYKQHFAKGFKAGRMDKIRHNNKQYNLNLKLMKDGSIRHGEQGVAEGLDLGTDVDTKGRTRAEWAKQIHIKYPKGFVAHQDDGTSWAVIPYPGAPDTKKVRWIKDEGVFEQGVAEEKQRLDPKCWDGYKKQGTKMKGGVRVNNCVKEEEITEAEYQGRKVALGKPMQGDTKKFKVYVKDPSTGNVKKVNFGDPNMRIKKSNPKRRKSFRARHNCANPGPRTKARYWSCRKW